MEDSLFQAHSIAVMSTVGSVADNAEDLDKVANTLMLLGAKHGATPDFSLTFMSMFIKCMEKTWERILGEEYTEDVQEAWLKLFQFIENKLVYGYHVFLLAGENEKNNEATDNNIETKEYITTYNSS